MREYFSNIWTSLATIAIGMKVTFKHRIVSIATLYINSDIEEDLAGKSLKTVLLSLIFLVLSANFILAQNYGWTQTSLDSGLVRDILIYDSTKIYSATNYGIYFTSDYGNNWILKNNGLACEPFKLIRDKAGNLYTAGLGGIFKSTDQGDSWLDISNSFTTNEFYSIALTKSEILLVSCFIGIFYSTNYGNSWIMTNYTNWGILEMISFSDSLVFAASNASSYSGIFKSTDNGKIWNYNVGLSSHSLLNVGDSVLFCGSQFPAGIYSSSDSGKSWNSTNHFQNSFDLTDFIINMKGNLFVSAVYPNCNNLCDIYKSSDFGVSWTQMGLTGKEIFSLATDCSGAIYAGSNYGIYKYDKIIPVELISFTAEIENDVVLLNWVTSTETNNLGFEIERKKQGGDWITVGFLRGVGTTSSPNNYTYKDKLFELGNYYYRIKQLDYNGNFKYYQSISVNFESLKEYFLFQNYPNPFNAETIIKFYLLYDSAIKLYIVNLIGARTELIINKEQSSGIHEIRWRNHELPSGLYLLILEANSLKSKVLFKDVRKIVIIK